jgi:hypothetical protein
MSSNFGGSLRAGGVPASRDRPLFGHISRLPNGEGQRNCFGGDVFGDVLERVDIEGLADVIAPRGHYCL